MMCISTNVSTSFWDWFLENIDVYEQLCRNNDKELVGWLEEINYQLQESVGHGVTAAFQHNKTKKRNYLTVIGEGDREQFNKVENLMTEAPPIDNWEFLSLHLPSWVERVALAKEIAHHTT